FILGLLYIIVFYIKILESIIFDYPFELEILRTKNTKTATHRTINIAKRIP
ncbi:hypothetical protein QBC45DRAFT_327435, partial [Copromyces sp. CBS 386.78]